MTAPAPGPWLALPSNRIVDTFGASVAFTTQRDGQHRNAELIAAAPSLARAVDLLLEQFANDLAWRGLTELEAECRTALARARGHYSLLEAAREAA